MIRPNGLKRFDASRPCLHNQPRSRQQAAAWRLIEAVMPYSVSLPVIAWLG